MTHHAAYYRARQDAERAWRATQPQLTLEGVLEETESGDVTVADSVSSSAPARGGTSGWFPDSPSGTISGGALDYPAGTGAAMSAVIASPPVLAGTTPKGDGASLTRETRTIPQEGA